INQSFDYIVVGGGTAGLVLAARLTEDAAISVLVLEAGEENLNDPMIVLSGQNGAHFGKPEYDWCLKTVPQVHSKGSEVFWPRGRILGGSSAINFMAWTKPSKSDIDAWERLGNGGWNWDRFDKYVQRVTSYTPLNLPEEEHVRRGTPAEARKLWDRQLGNGPIHITHPPLRLDVDTKLEQAYRNLGIPMAPAPIDGNPNGIFTAPVTEDPMTLQRSFAGNAYWAPNSSRPNFRVLTGALAHRLVSESINGELVVTGVEFSHKSAEDKTHVVNASKEVVLSAGALKTPQILELSGIGRPDILEKIKVPVKLPLA
ncbi:GMC oxidoreductase, partial [Macrolepiota fuliginosa MF-IS2]